MKIIPSKPPSQTAAISDLRADYFSAYRAAVQADDAWQAQLTAKFGRDACNRRYDMDQSGHSTACRVAYQAWRVAVEQHDAALRLMRAAS